MAVKGKSTMSTATNSNYLENFEISAYYVSDAT